MLSNRLGLIGQYCVCAVLGLAVMAFFSLNTLYSTMHSDRKNEIKAVLILAAKQVEYFKSLEQAGKLSKDEAQAKAVEALTSLRDGNASYLWARTTEAVGLVLPGNQDALGKTDFGVKLPDGRFTFQLYLDELARNEIAYVEVQTNKAGVDGLVTKLNGVVKISGWNWVVGYGAWLDDIEAAYWSLAWRVILIGFVVMAFVVALATFMARGVFKRIGGEPDYAAKVTQTIAAGDLQQRIEGSFAEDSLLSSVATMQTSLREMIGSIQHGTQLLGQASASLNSQMRQISDASSHSEEATSSTASAMEELAVSIEHISGIARQTEENSVRSSALASEGERMVNSAAEKIQDVSLRVAEAEGLIGGLLDRSRQIDSIVGVIKEIADQTNLLALNAAIEAARAGESGRGFAVVADEVRKLAERTTKATAQITQMINAIQLDTGSVVQSMQAVTPQVAQGVELASAAAAALREINDGVSANLSNVRDVASATAEQSQASASVAQNVERVTEMLEKSTSSVRMAYENVQKLEQLSGKLSESVARFRV